MICLIGGVLLVILAILFAVFFIWVVKDTDSDLDEW